MPKEIKCPECGSYNIEEIPYKGAIDREGPHREYLKEAEYSKYECLDCGMVFFESNLREQ
jgi:DNA-directed RNA polymerase subunit RPC12/RpoP